MRPGRRREDRGGPVGPVRPRTPGRPRTGLLARAARRPQVTSPKPPRPKALSPMPFFPFELERWQSTWENRVRFNLSESGVHPLSVGELLDLAAETADPLKAV